MIEKFAKLWDKPLSKLTVGDIAILLFAYCVIHFVVGVVLAIFR